MNLPPYRQVLECASPLALSDLVRGRKSGRGLPQSKTLARLRPPRRGSWSQCMRKSERRLSMNGPLSLPSPAQSGREGGRRPGEGELEFMVPRPARHRKQARNQTTHPRPLPGGELVFVRVLSVPLLGGVRGGFMALGYAQHRKEALHLGSGD